jgi:hypothetical protein
MLAIMRKRIFLNRGRLVKSIESPPEGHLRGVRGSIPLDVVIGRGPLSVTPEVELIDWRFCPWRMTDIPLFSPSGVQENTNSGDR